jgi:hypothetical protein
MQVDGNEPPVINNTTSLSAGIQTISVNDDSDLIMLYTAKYKQQYTSSPFIEKMLKQTTFMPPAHKQKTIPAQLRAAITLVVKQTQALHEAYQDYRRCTLAFTFSITDITATPPHLPHAHTGLPTPNPIPNTITPTDIDLSILSHPFFIPHGTPYTVSLNKPQYKLQPTSLFATQTNRTLQTLFAPTLNTINTRAFIITFNLKLLRLHKLISSRNTLIAGQIKSYKLNAKRVGMPIKTEREHIIAFLDIVKHS